MSKKLVNDQMKYIYNNLKNFSVCSLTNKYIPNNIDQISTPIVKSILTNNFNNGPDMNAVLCLFDTLFLSTEKKKERGLYHLSINVNKWVQKMEKIDVKSSESYVYISDILSDIQVIIKIPKKLVFFNDIIREYFIGITEINKLRHIVPNFLYTFGAFICPTPKKDKKLCKGKNETAFVLYEKIPGKTIEYLLKNNKINFSDYLGMFIQLLIALEVGQKSIDFCHFDLHTGNIMAREINNIHSYIVPLNNKIYTITSEKYIPTIIDFGMTTIRHDDKIIGSYHFPEHGMMNYLLPGVDMYKFLIYSCIYSSGILQRQIMKLLTFYGSKEPYKILTKNTIKKAQKEYASKGSFSSIATYTPIYFLEWIINNPEYKNIVKNYIKVSDRNIYTSLNFSTTIQQYNNIFRRPLEGRENAITIINKSSIINSSYIMSMYSNYVLTGYNSSLKSSKILEHIKTNQIKILKHKNTMIQNDKNMLNLYTSIPIPDFIIIQEYSKRILNINIKSTKKKTEIQKLINKYIKSVSFFKKLQPYLQFLYTIRELNLEHTYTDFISFFISSEQYKLYNKLQIIIERTSRWCKTLVDSELF